MNLGDTVTWASQSAGWVKVKTGVIVVIVEAGQQVDTSCRLCLGSEWRECYQAKNIISYTSFPRKHVSYVVAVQDGKKGKPVLYWPLVKNLRKVK